MWIKQKLYEFIPYLLTLLLFLFLLWMIVIADMGSKNFFFEWVRSIHNGDKMAHFILYGVLTFLLNRALELRTLTFLGYKLQWGALFVLSFAIIEELSQYFFPSRTLSAADVIADMIGVSLFSYLSAKQPIIRLKQKNT